MDNSLLLFKIEQCRAEMIALSNEHGLSSCKVIRVSKELDSLLNEYRKQNKTSHEKTNTYSL